MSDCAVSWPDCIRHCSSSIVSSSSAKAGTCGCARSAVRSRSGALAVRSSFAPPAATTAARVEPTNPRRLMVVWSSRSSVTRRSPAHQRVLVFLSVLESTTKLPTSC